MKAAATKRSNEKRKAKVDEYKASRLSVVKDTTINEELNDMILELKEDWEPNERTINYIDDVASSIYF